MHDAVDLGFDTVDISGCSVRLRAIGMRSPCTPSIRIMTDVHASHDLMAMLFMQQKVLASRTKVCWGPAQAIGPASLVRQQRPAVLLPHEQLAI